MNKAEYGEIMQKEGEIKVGNSSEAGEIFKISYKGGPYVMKLMI